MIGFGSDLDERCRRRSAWRWWGFGDVLEVVVPAIVEVAGGIGDGILVEQLVVVVEVGDVLAHG